MYVHHRFPFNIFGFVASDGKQIGDSVMGAKAILQAVDSAAPLHLSLGLDALRRARTRIEQMTQQINELGEPHSRHGFYRDAQALDSS